MMIRGVTGETANGPFAGVAVGITLAVTQIVGIQVIGVAVNSARGFGPAVLAGGQALSKLWLFIVPLLTGAMLFRLKVLDPDA